MQQLTCKMVWSFSFWKTLKKCAEKCQKVRKKCRDDFALQLLPFSFSLTFVGIEIFLKSGLFNDIPVRISQKSDIPGSSALGVPTGFRAPPVPWSPERSFCLTATCRTTGSCIEAPGESGTHKEQISIRGRPRFCHKLSWQQLLSSIGTKNREELKGTNGTNGFLQKICGFLRKSALRTQRALRLKKFNPD